jgi:hypothetical protein
MPPLKHPLRVGRAGGHWLRQATVLGLGIGLLAGTGLIATASAASAHPNVAGASAGHGPPRACAVIVRRKGQIRVQRQRCLPGTSVQVPVRACQLRLRPGPAGVQVQVPRPARQAIKAPGQSVVRVPPGKPLPRILRLRPGTGRQRVLRVLPAKGLQRVLRGKPQPPVLRIRPGQRLQVVRPGRVRLSRVRRQAPVAVQAPVTIKGSACPTPPVLRVRPGQVRLCRVARAKQASAARCCVIVARPQRLVRPGRLPRPGRLRLQVSARACAVAPPSARG